MEKYPEKIIDYASTDTKLFQIAVDLESEFKKLS